MEPEVSNYLDELNITASSTDSLTEEIRDFIESVLEDTGSNELRVRPYGVQPDGDYVGASASGVQLSETFSLAIGETVTTDFFDTDGYRTIEVFVQSDQPSAENGIKVEYTDDAQAEPPQVLSSRSKTYNIQDANRGFAVFKFPTDLDGARVSITNDGLVASDVDVIVTLRTEPSDESAKFVDTNTLGEEFIRVGSSTESAGIKVGQPTSLFGDLETIERRTIVDLTSAFGTSIIRDEIETTGSGVITEDPDPDTGEVELSTGTTANSSVIVSSSEFGRYTPGFAAQQGMGVRIPTLPTEGELKWGYYDDNNGFYWGYDTTEESLFVARRANGTETERVYEENWNGFDPEEVLGREFDPTEGDIWQIDFSWYGYGIVNFQLVSQSNDTTSGLTPRQETVGVHSLVVRGETSTSDPNEPIRIEAENAGGGEDVRVRYGGRQFSVFGQPPTEKRTTSETNLSETIADGAWTHVMSWRRAVSTDSNARLDIKDIDFGIDQTTKLAIVINADVTSDNFGVPELTDPDETLLEVSTNETFNGIGGGTKVWGASVKVPGTGAAQADLGDVDIDIGFGQTNTISLIAQSDGATGDATTTMRLTEDW